MYESDQCEVCPTAAACHLRGHPKGGGLRNEVTLTRRGPFSNRSGQLMDPGSEAGMTALIFSGIR